MTDMVIQPEPIDERWMDSPELIQFSDEESIGWSRIPDRTFLIRDGVPPHIDPKKVRYVSLFESRPGLLQRVPDFLRRFTHLVCLHLPSYTVEAMKPGDVADTLRVLSVYGDNFALPREMYFPHLEVLETAWLKWRFSPESLPALTDLSTNLDRKGMILRAISSLPSLRGLATGPVRDAAFFVAIAPLGLEHLTLWPGRKLTRLDGLERVATLRSLIMVRFKRLESIEPVAALPLLEDVFFHNCAGLPSLAPLASCASLKSLRFLGCGRLQWDGARERLTARSVQIDDAFT
jgi:hypothetical protein